jgi:RNA polymerase sigma factor (sigma-70 family)
MMEDGQLLRSYAEQGSEAAFHELVARHMDLVYSTALRRADGDACLAQDVAQQVFTDLALNARQVSRRFILGGWLYRHSCFLASRLLRAEHRRQARERAAVAMHHQDHHAPEEGLWQQLAPVLDQAMFQLNQADRDALVLRFFQNRDLRQVGAAIGVSEDTAQKRVSRALEKLRKVLVKQGITSASSAALAAILTGFSVSAAPAGLATSVAASSLASAAAASGLTVVLANLMTIAKLKFALGAVVVVGLGTAVVIEQQAWTTLRRQNEALRSRVEQLTRQAQEQQPFAQLPVQAIELGTGQQHRLSELERLRAAVGALRPQTNELATLRAENRRLRALSTGQNSPQPDESEDPAETEFKKETQNRVNDFRQWGLMFITHALKANNRFPETWEQVAEQVSPEARASFINTATNNYEIVYRGESASNGITSNSPANPGETLLFREKQARRSPKGEWVKVYGYVDGSTETHTEPSDNFSTWEAQHMVPSR